MFKKCFQVLFLFSLFSCSPKVIHQPSSDKKELHFIKKLNSDHAEILKKSKDIYSGSPQCSSSGDCRQICDTLFSSSVEKECSGLQSQQVYQIQSLYEKFLTEELIELKKINPFDLKVFFSLSSEVLFEFLKTIKPHSIKTFLSWIVEDWKIATVFQQEDSYFLYMQLFLNELNISPIRSLREDLKGDKTFVELSWVKQNDKALIWLDGYLENIYCESENEKETCMLGAYCMLYDSWEHHILLEIQESDILSSLLGESTDFQERCSEFCQSENCQKGV